jgi:putative (di)nucleoside polyphosphate hydrolase
MKTSCGIIILNEQNEIFMGHVTGQKYHDIPKGMLEENETPITCALRETEEETGLVLQSDKLVDLGLLDYNREKKLHLFLYTTYKANIDLDKCVCNSYFEHFYTKKLTPEVDSFHWINVEHIDASCAKSMTKLLLKLIADNKLN